MLSKEERKALHTAFWTKFKAQAGKNLSASGKRIKWVNYPTQVKQLFIRLSIQDKTARFAIEIQDKDEEIRKLIWEQFKELKKVLENEMKAPGDWQNTAYNDADQIICRIAWSLPDVSLNNKKDQQKIIQFFIEYSLRFDRFYSEYGDIIIHLAK